MSNWHLPFDLLQFPPKEEKSKWKNLWWRDGISQLTGKLESSLGIATTQLMLFLTSSTEMVRNRFKCSKLRNHRSAEKRFAPPNKSRSVFWRNFRRKVDEYFCRCPDSFHYHVNAGRVHDSQRVRGAKTFRVIEFVDCGATCMFVNVEMETERITPLDVKHIVDCNVNEIWFCRAVFPHQQDRFVSLRSFDTKKQIALPSRCRKLLILSVE